jgi:hypothetical protein
MNRKRTEEEEKELMLAQAIIERRAIEREMLKRQEDEAVEQQKQALANTMTQDIQENADSALQAVQNDTALTSNQKEDLVIATTNPIDVQRSVKRNLATRDAQEGSSKIKDQFLDALTFFGPQIIGGLFGGLAEGDAGMLAGAEMGAKMRDQYIDYNFKKMDAARSGTKLQQSGEFMTKDGKPLMFDPTRGFLDMQGRKVKQEDVVSGIERRQEVSIKERRKSRELAEKKFGFDKQKAAQLSDSQINKITDLNSTEEAVKEITSLFSDAKTGPIIGRVQSLGQLLDEAPSVFNKLKAEASAARLAYQRATSGLQVNEKEMQLIGSIIPSENDAPNVFKDKLEVFQRIVSQHKKSFAAAISYGQPLKQEVIQSIMEEVDLLDKKLRAKGAAPLRRTRRRVTAADIDKMSKEELKAYLGE